MKQIGAVLVAAFICLPAYSQATRTWVSGVGDDVNPCSRTAPCKTFAGAISKTAAGGEIDTLDPGGFGTLTITKAMTVDGGPYAGGILNAGTNGVIINAGVNDVVILRNLTIQGNKTGVNTRGIRFLAGAALIIENCTIVGNTQRAISIENSSSARVTILSSRIYDNSSNGVVVMPASGTPTLNIMLDDVQVTNNVNFGVYAGPGSVMTIRNSLIAQNGLAGVVADQSSNSTQVNIERTTISHNGTGIQAGPGAATVRISDTTITNNPTAGFFFNGGTVLTYGNNRVVGNGASNGPANGGAVPLNPQ